MSGHCHSHHNDGHDKCALWIALILNLGMFILEIWQGHMAHSTSLLADSMDFMGDSFSYAVSLFVLHKALGVRAKAALLKACIMLALAAIVLWKGVDNIMTAQVPAHFTMGWVAVLGLLANLISAALLYATRNSDSNMQSVWLCSRNDAIGNAAIIVAAGLVYFTGTLWPDLLVALIMAWLGISAAIKIIRRAGAELSGAS